MSTGNHAVSVKVKARYLADQSRPEYKKFAFAYTITIANRGNSKVQLLSRRWTIIDDKGAVKEVAGIGVVGETPLIEPGNEYTYTSGAIIETPSGRMEGSYQMIDTEGEPFEVPVPAFLLLPPNLLH